MHKELTSKLFLQRKKLPVLSPMSFMTRLEFSFADFVFQLILMVVLVIERRKGEHSSAIVFIFWLLWTIVEALILISKVEEQRVKVRGKMLMILLTILCPTCFKNVSFRVSNHFYTLAYYTNVILFLRLQIYNRRCFIVN